MKEFRWGDIVPSCDDVYGEPDLVSQVEAVSWQGEAQGLLEILRRRLHGRVGS